MARAFSSAKISTADAPSVWNVDRNKNVKFCSLSGGLYSATFYALFLNLPTSDTYTVPLYNKIFSFYPSLGHKSNTHTDPLLEDEGTRAYSESTIIIKMDEENR